MSMTPRTVRFLLCPIVVAMPGLALAQAQATVKPDGKFRYALGAGGSYSSGNTSAASVNLSGDSVRATDDTKFELGGKALWSRSEGTTTAENISLGTQYNKDITPLYFGLGSADFLRDKFANISSRVAAHVGLGRHVVKRDDLTWDVSAGVGYTQDRYLEAADIHGALRDNYGRAEGLIAEESSHKWTSTTSFHQKLSVYPTIGSGGGIRTDFDAALSVSMTSTLALTAGLTHHYNSDPGAGLKHDDTLFVTGISVKID